MQLVPKDIHDKTAHTGGVAMIKVFGAAVGSLVSSISEASPSDWLNFGVDLGVDMINGALDPMPPSAPIEDLEVNSAK